LWRHDVTTPGGEDRASGVTVDVLGNVLVTGHTTGSFDATGNKNEGKYDVYVRKLNPSGSLVWTNLFGNALDQRARTVATSSTGRVVMGGSTQGELDAPSAGSWDAFVAVLKP
jgi:hypothetical protein